MESAFLLFQYEPFQKYIYSENGTIAYSGLCFEIVNALAEFLEFTYVSTFF